MKKLNKLFALCLVLMLTVVSVYAEDEIAGQVEIKEGFWDNFEEYNVGSYAKAVNINSKYSSGGGTVYIVDNPYYPTMGKSLHCQADSTFFTTQWDMTKANVIKTYAPYLSVSMRVIPEENAHFVVHVCGNASKVQNHKEPSTETAVFRMSNGLMTTGGGRASLGELEPGKVYDVNVIINTKGGAPNTAIYNVYINGEKKTTFSAPTMAGDKNDARINMTGICYMKYFATNVLIDDLSVRGADKDGIEELMKMPTFDWSEEIIAERNKKVKYFEDLAVPEKNYYNDISDSKYKDAINALAAYGALNVPADGMFRPNDKITRAEMAALTVKLANVTIYRFKNAFIDVSPDKWYANSIQSAVNGGLVATPIIASGYYFPESPATLSDVVTYAICLREIYSSVDEQVSLVNYVDYRGISDEVSEYFAKAVASGIYTPENNRLNPNKMLTRAEAINMLYMAIKDI